MFRHICMNGPGTAITVLARMSACVMESVGGAETALFVLGFRQRLYDADARDVLAHRAPHAVEPLLHAAMPSNSRMGMRVHIV